MVVGINLFRNLSARKSVTVIVDNNATDIPGRRQM
jgi:hypothetical protein